MPFYEYQAIEQGCPHCQDGFEELRKTTDAELTTCPQCQAPVQRILSGFAMAGKEKKMMDPKNLERLGFTQYKKAGGGKYEKSFGK